MKKKRTYNSIFVCLLKLNFIPNMADILRGEAKFQRGACAQAPRPHVEAVLSIFESWYARAFPKRTLFFVREDKFI